MDQDKQQRRVKVTDGATHRVGTKRAAIKPHKRVTEPKQIIADYLGGIRQGSLSQTYHGDTIAKNAVALCKNFGIPTTDEPYLLVDPSGTGRMGMLLSSTGIHLADGRGGTAAIAWADLPANKVGYQSNGMLVIGQSGISTKDGQALVGLLQKLQTAYTK